MLESEFDEAVEATPRPAPAGPAVPRPREAGPLPDRIRHRFPIFERLVYINSCSQGALSDSVRQAYGDYLRDWDDRGSPWEYWVEQTERARASFAGLVNAAPDEIAVTSSISEGVSAIATGLRYGGRRNKIVLTDYEFPTVGQIFHAQESRGARVVHVPAASDGTIPIEGFERAIDDETLLVGLPHVSYRTGTMLDVERVTQLAHDRGALVLVDAYQAAGSVPIDVKALDVDVLGAGALKYLLGSAGLAFLYCRRELVERFWPTSTGWFADEDIFKMDHRDYSPATTAARFQSGTPPVPAIYAGVAGIELMKEIGVQETRDHVLGLNSRLIEGLDELRVKTRDTAAAEAARGADLRRIVRRARAGGHAAPRRHRHLVARLEPAHLGALLQRRRGRGRGARVAGAAPPPPGSR